MIKFNSLGKFDWSNGISHIPYVSGVTLSRLRIWVSVLS